MKCYVNYVLSVLGLLFWTACVREEMKVSSGSSETVELSFQVDSRTNEGRTCLLSQENVSTINGIHVYLFDGATEDARCVYYKYWDYKPQTESLRTSIKVDEDLKEKDLTVMAIGMSPNKETYPLPGAEQAVGHLSIKDLHLSLQDGMSEKMKETEVFAGYKVFTGKAATVSVELKRVVAGVICYVDEIPAMLEGNKVTALELRLLGGQNTCFSLLPYYSNPTSGAYSDDYGTILRPDYNILTFFPLEEYSDTDGDGLLNIPAATAGVNHPATVENSAFFSAYFLAWKYPDGKSSHSLELVLKAGEKEKVYPVAMAGEGTKVHNYSLERNKLYTIGVKPVAETTEKDNPYPLGIEEKPGVTISVSSWDETIEQDVDFPIFGILVDKLPAHVCRGSVVNVKADGNTVATDYMFVFKPHNDRGENMERQYKLNSGIYTMDTSDLTEGEYLVDIYNVIEGEQGEIVSADLRMVVHPAASRWIGGADGKTNDWNTWENWSKGVPYICTDVHIPNGCQFFPDLKTADEVKSGTDGWYEDNYCGKIQFDADAQVRGLCYLKYSEGFVDLHALRQNEVRILFVPLSETYSGDFFSSTYDPTILNRPEGFETCWPWLDDATYPIDEGSRYNPRIYQRSMIYKNAGSMSWTNAYNIMNILENPGRSILRYNMNETMKTQVYRFPIRHTIMYYYDSQGIPIKSDVLERKNLNRFYYDSEEYVVEASTDSKTTAFMVGNVFMTGLDVKALLEENPEIESVQLLKTDLEGNRVGSDASSYLNELFQSPVTLENSEDVVVPHGHGFLVNMKLSSYKSKIVYSHKMEVWEK